MAARRLRHGAAGPIGAERARLHHGDLDAERRHLLRQGIREALHGVFGGRVIARAREAAEARHRGDVDDVAAPLPAHHGQHGARHGEEAEDVGLELGADLLRHALLDGGQVAVAGVVHQHVDAAERPHRGLHAGLDLVVVDHVERQRERAVLAALREILDARLVARRDDGPPAAVEHQLRQFAAEAGGAAGDEPHRGRFIRHVVRPSAVDQRSTIAIWFSV